ncbi:hypothetical protein [Streptacidiphilus sp. P02-A3a]|uniref:hypothetical protein n=1 Tax=Streptacidiphilus sp. P02-A3a TaxID=2704468 RepID=UPI0015FC59E8|nr:hypothetical protein [Streptacidiphilus sp. P02-A3a]QMU72140.1 hypothetical protein GXP74_31775 [Streptacidiphilus sp. P02-A3a]
MTAPLPDVESLVHAALRDGLPGAAVRVMWPAEWADVLPLVVARRVSGVAVPGPGLDVAVIDVQSAAPTRPAAGLLARQVRPALLAAARAQYRGADGYLGHVEESAGPVELRAGVPSPGSDLFVFTATYRVTARPTHGE